MNCIVPSPDPRSSLRVGALVITAALSASAALAQEPVPAPVISAAPSVGGTAPDAHPSQAGVLSYGTPGTHVTVLENTLIRVMTDQPLSSQRSKDGTDVLFTVSEDVIVNHVLVIPRGTTVHGKVIQHKKAGVLSGSPGLTLELVSLDLGGENYPLYTYQFKAWGESKTKPSANLVGQGAEFGALAGAVVSAKEKGGPTRASNIEDMTAGAAVGAGVVAAAAAVTPRPVLAIPAESQMDFYLASPISVQPVSAKEAERLGQRVHPGGPVLYVRGDGP
jgi:hypothetical protein